MERVVPVVAPGGEGFGEEAVGGEHDRDLAGLHGDDEVVEVEVTADFDDFDGRLDHALGGVTKGEEHALGERAVVDADAERLVLAFERLDERRKHLLEFDLGGVELLLGELGPVGVALLDDVEAGVDADLVDVLGDLERDLHAVVVHVGDERHVHVLLAELVLDVADRERVGHGRDGEPHHLAPFLVKRDNRRRRAVQIERVLVDHALHDHRVIRPSPDEEIIGHAHRSGDTVWDGAGRLVELDQPGLIAQRVLVEHLARGRRRARRAVFHGRRGARGGARGGPHGDTVRGPPGGAAGGAAEALARRARAETAGRGRGQRVRARCELRFEES
mmetsp:Transcript_15133/g.40717  ORF Transcript_15133/g.40717 Transcript_15133/m.40717 type:complete len:332 (-) Transcript_15133:390-1385(-)